MSLSNFAFDADSGYFAAPAQTKPLLHTWSLGVEWQFYIWMPLIAAVIWRKAVTSKPRTKVLTGAFCLFALVSFLWCVWQSQTDLTGSAFFSLRARAWEPLSGGLIALVEQRLHDDGIKAPKSEMPPRHWGGSYWRPASYIPCPNTNGLAFPHCYQLSAPFSSSPLAGRAF